MLCYISSHIWPRLMVEFALQTLPVVMMERKKLWRVSHWLLNVLSIKWYISFLITTNSSHGLVGWGPSSGSQTPAYVLASWKEWESSLGSLFLSLSFFLDEKTVYFKWDIISIIPKILISGNWCWERLRAGGEEGAREWDGWMASPIQWPWVWANSGK